jgi:hypothetical protein
MNEEQKKLEAALENASKDLVKAKAGAMDAENKYGSAYQALVKAGYRRQIRLKYRGK